MKRLMPTIAVIVATILSFTSCSANFDFNEKTTFIRFTDSSDSYTITDGGTYNFSGVLTDGKISVEAKEDVTIILSGVEIANSTDEAIKIESTGKTVIKTSDGTENVITGGGDAAINAKSDIEFLGNGSLTVNGSTKHGIECDTDITVTSGTIKINSYEHGMKSESVITILGGTLDIYAETGKGIKAEKEFLGENGVITITTPENEGLESKGALTINGGNYDITAGEDGINAGTSDKTTKDTAAESETSTTQQATAETPENMNAIPEGGNSTGAMPPEGAQPERFRPEERFPMDGEGEPTNNGEMPKDRPVRGERPVMEGKVEGEARFDVPPDVTYSGTGLPMGVRGDKGGFGMVNEDSVLTINGGHIKINCLGDGIDSNGSLTINGGTVIIDGPNNSGNGPLDSDGEMTINGGTVLTASSKGMTQMPRSMTQGIINLSFDKALEQGEEIVIMDSDSKIITEHTVGKTCELLIYTSPEIKHGESYKIYVNGQEHETVLASDGFVGMGGPGMPGGRGGMGGKFPGHGEITADMNTSETQTTAE